LLFRLVEIDSALLRPFVLTPWTPLESMSASRLSGTHSMTSTSKTFVFHSLWNTDDNKFGQGRKSCKLNCCWLDPVLFTNESWPEGQQHWDFSEKSEFSCLTTGIYCRITLIRLDKCAWVTKIQLVK
jgi:hypothetical protein